MANFNFSKAREEAEDKYNLGKGQYFKVKEGINRIRLISECLPHASDYQGKPTFKWLCQVIDRRDGKLKPYFMPDKVYKGIMNLQLDEEYSFDGVPMPYDLNIQTVNAGKMDVIYTVIPAKNNVALTEEEQKLIKESPSVRELQAKVRENDGKKEEGSASVENVNVDEIPF